MICSLFAYLCNNLNGRAYGINMSCILIVFYLNVSIQVRFIITTIVYNKSMRFKRNIQAILIIIVIVIFLLGISEMLARILTQLHTLSYYKPIELIVQHEQKEELRLSNVFSGAESDFEYDPVLFWKPKKNSGIFNEVGIRGLSIVSSRDSATSSCTILAYGDSNTLGAYQGGYYDTPWPDELFRLLRQHISSIRVLNMGVHGYTSYQGLQKFYQDITVFHPTFVIVAFGWNDASPDMGIPDKQFNTYLSPLISPLNKSKLFQVLKYYSDIFVNKYLRKPMLNGPRVSFEDFKQNLINFIQLANKNHVSVILLTRPHADFTYANIENWRIHVPEYNKIIHEVASDYNVPLIDFEKLFLEQYSNELIDDCHFTQKGHLIAANELYSYFQQQNIVCK